MLIREYIETLLVQAASTPKIKKVTLFFSEKDYPVSHVVDYEDNSCIKIYAPRKRILENSKGELQQ